MATTTSARITLVYEDATSKNYTFNGVDEMMIGGVKDKVIAINQSLTAGTANDFANTFVSANGQPCKLISDARIITIEQEVIYNAS